MTATEARRDAQASADSMDQRVFLHGVSWEQYEQLLAMRGESSGVRITYLEGEVELMSPGYDHEWIKKTFARLVETFAEVRDVDLTGVGSWTLKKELRERGLEPDECYHLGSEEPELPDFAVEVVWTSGGIDKLEVYRGLGVPEVWIWQDGRIDVWRLRDDAYERAERSGFLPDLDLPRLAGILEVHRGSQTAAVRAYRRFLTGTE